MRNVARRVFVHVVDGAQLVRRVGWMWCFVVDPDGRKAFEHTGICSFEMQRLGVSVAGRGRRRRRLEIERLFDSNRCL